MTLEEKLYYLKGLYENKSDGTQTEYPVYTGSYIVTPSAHNSVVLESKNKIMKADVTVREIQRFDVSNQSGGTTLFIASEV